MIYIIPFEATCGRTSLEGMKEVARLIQEAQEQGGANGEVLPEGAEVIDVGIDTRNYYYGVITGWIKIRTLEPLVSPR